MKESACAMAAAPLSSILLPDRSNVVSVEFDLRACAIVNPSDCFLIFSSQEETTLKSVCERGFPMVSEIKSEILW